MAVIKGSSEYGTQRKWNPRSVTLLACPECSSLHQYKQSLLRHRRDAHGFVPEFQCELCSVLLQDPKEIEEHIAKHEKQVKQVCPICNETLTTKTSLIRHMRYKHTNEREFKCDICGFSCVEHYKLQIHIRSHTGETPFSCLECGSAFKSKVSLTRHKATHSDKRDYICTLCFQQFAISNTLRNHLRLVHKVYNAFLDGIKNSLLHGIPVMMEKFLQNTGQNIEDFGKVRYYGIKEEYISNLDKHFQAVSPILISSNVSSSEASSISVEASKKKDGLGFIPVMGRRKRKGDNNRSHSRATNLREQNVPNNESEKPDDFEIVDTGDFQENREYEYAFIDTIENGVETEQIETMQDYSLVKMEVVHEEILGENEQVNSENNNEEIEVSEEMETVPITYTVEMSNNVGRKNNEGQSQTEVDENFNVHSDVEVAQIEKSLSGKDVDKEMNKETSRTLEKSTESDKTVSEKDQSKEDNTSKCDMNLKDICIPVNCDEQLKKMKKGTFGKTPQVIEVLPDGSIMDITEEFSDYLPQTQ